MPSPSVAYFSANSSLILPLSLSWFAFSRSRPPSSLFEHLVEALAALAAVLAVVLGDELFRDLFLTCPSIDLKMASSSVPQKSSAATLTRAPHRRPTYRL